MERHGDLGGQRPRAGSTGSARPANRHDVDDPVLSRVRGAQPERRERPVGRLVPAHGHGLLNRRLRAAAPDLDHDVAQLRSDRADRVQLDEDAGFAAACGPPDETPHRRDRPQPTAHGTVRVVKQSAD